MQQPHPPRRPRSPPSSGFTLIEVLIALFILALMASMSWQGVDMVMRTRNAAQTRLDELLRLQSAMAQWEIDLRSIYDPAFITNKLLVPAWHFDGRTVRLVRRQSEGPVLVTWSLQDGQWKRWSSPVLTDTEKLQKAWIDSWQNLGTEPGTLIALRGLRAWHLIACYQPNNCGNALSTGDQQQGDSTKPQVAGMASDALPIMVRLILELDPAGGHSGKLVRDVRLIHP